MTPARQDYRAPDHVCRLFEALRAAQLATVTGFPIGKLEPAENRGGGGTGWKRHLHHSKFDDIKTGFEFDVWPDHLDERSDPRRGARCRADRTRSCCRPRRRSSWGQMIYRQGTVELYTPSIPVGCSP